MEKNKFTIVNAEGQTVEYDVLFTFESDETGKKYIVYTDHTKTEEGTVKVYASIYTEDNDATELNLVPIETEKEWNIIETILKSLEEELNKKEEN